jgi:hypothetical protein
MGGTARWLGNYLKSGLGADGSDVAAALRNPAVRSTLIYGSGATEWANADAHPK